MFNAGLTGWQTTTDILFYYKHLRKLKNILLFENVENTIILDIR